MFQINIYLSKLCDIVFFSISHKGTEQVVIVFARLLLVKSLAYTIGDVERLIFSPAPLLSSA